MIYLGIDVVGVIDLQGMIPMAIVYPLRWMLMTSLEKERFGIGKEDRDGKARDIFNLVF
jgi:hypothetical protein